MREAEGLSVVTDEIYALRRGWPVAMRAAWLTLKVHSDLNAIGLTAAISRVLAAQRIPCNVIAGVCHDHVFVPHARGAAARCRPCVLSRATHVRGEGKMAAGATLAARTHAKLIVGPDGAQYSRRAGGQSTGALRAAASPEGAKSTQYNQWRGEHESVLQTI